MKKRGILLLVLCMASLWIAPCLGASLYSFQDILRSILHPASNDLIFMLRIPRVLLGALIGASLSVCGVVMQVLVRNELADPFLLGISSGAGAFATLDLLFGVFAFLGVFRLPLSAFMGAMSTILLVFSISVSKGTVQISTLLLSGVAVSMIMDGLTRLITLLAPNALGLHNATFWLSGSLTGARWDYLRLPLVVLMGCMLLLYLFHRQLDLMSLGEAQAKTLGVSVKKMQIVLIVIASLLAGVSVALSGTIGFVGLMCPHFARMLVGSKHQYVLPFSALIGAILVIWTDVLARCLFAPEEVPIGVLTAIIGGPIFIGMLKHKKRRSK